MIFGLARAVAVSHHEAAIARVARSCVTTFFPSSFDARLVVKAFSSADFQA
jgi:hypothetical protein